MLKKERKGEWERRSRQGKYGNTDEAPKAQDYALNVKWPHTRRWRIYGRSTLGQGKWPVVLDCEQRF